MLISGGEVTVPKLFVNNSNGRIAQSITKHASPLKYRWNIILRGNSAWFVIYTEYVLAQMLAVECYLHFHITLLIGRIIRVSLSPAGIYKEVLPKIDLVVDRMTCFG